MKKEDVVKRKEVGKRSNKKSLPKKEPLKFLGRTIRKGSLVALPEVHPELAGLLPPDSEAYSALEEMIVREGRVSSSIITCIIDGVEYVLDGHMRQDVIAKNGIKDFTIETLDHIKTVEEARCWIILNACSHRRLNRAQRVKLVRKLKPMLEAVAKTNQKLGATLKKAFAETEKAGKPMHVAKELAKMAGTSPDFFRDADYVFENGNPEEKGKLLKDGYGASKLAAAIKLRLTPPKPDPEVISYTNPKDGEYIDRIINADCIQTLKDMHYNGIKDVALMVSSINYNVNMDYGSDFSDDLPRDEYLDNVAQAIYHAQRLGRDGMRICVNCTDTNNGTKDNGDYQFDIGKDLGNKIDELNAKYDDCNLRFWGRFLWLKNHSNAPVYLGSAAAPVLKNDSEYILVWTKNQRKLENVSGINCKPGSGIVFSDTERDRYIITEKERMAWSYQAWYISPVTNKKQLDVHPCPFPEDIPHRLIKLFSNPNDIVIDPFMGIATTCKVASDLGRRYVGIDLNSGYCDFGKKRIEKSIENRNTNHDDLDDDTEYCQID